MVEGGRTEEQKTDKNRSGKGTIEEKRWREEGNVFQRVRWRLAALVSSLTSARGSTHEDDITSGNQNPLTDVWSQWREGESWDRDVSSVSFQFTVKFVTPLLWIPWHRRAVWDDEGCCKLLLLRGKHVYVWGGVMAVPPDACWFSRCQGEVPPTVQLSVGWKGVLLQDWWSHHLRWDEKIHINHLKAHVTSTSRDASDEDCRSLVVETVRVQKITL